MPTLKLQNISWKEGASFMKKWYQKRAPRVETYSYSDYMRLNYFVGIDLLKLLVDGRDYSREI